MSTKCIQTHQNKREQKNREEKTLTCTVVVVSYLKDFVCPFSRNTFNTFAICGTHRSPNENADGCEKKMF